MFEQTKKMHPFFVVFDYSPTSIISLVPSMRSASCLTAVSWRAKKITSLSIFCRLMERIRWLHGHRHWTPRVFPMRPSTFGRIGSVCRDPRGIFSRLLQRRKKYGIRRPYFSLYFIEQMYLWYPRYWAARYEIIYESRWLGRRREKLL